MPAQYTRTLTARARDLNENDVVKIDGTWRLIMDIHKSAEDAEAHFGNGIENYPEMRQAADEAFGRWEGDYLVIRFVNQERSTPDTAEDVVRVLFSWDLVEVQSRPAHAPEEYVAVAKGAS